jgi:hypothetical protein
MPVITISFYDGDTGEMVEVPSDFALRLSPIGSQPQEVAPVTASDYKFIAVAESGIFTAHFGSEKKIVSLDPETPGDITLLVLDGEEARAYFDLYLWDLKPVGTAVAPPHPTVGVTCEYCVSRYNTPGTPYYKNTTWYLNCYNNPPCTQ